MNNISKVILWFFLITIIIMSAPILEEAISVGSASSGTATSFFISLIPWMLLLSAIIFLWQTVGRSNTTQ